jgi:hypothetical protein
MFSISSSQEPSQAHQVLEVPEKMSLRRFPVLEVLEKMRLRTICRISIASLNQEVSSPGFTMER